MIAAVSGTARNALVMPQIQAVTSVPLSFTSSEAYQFHWTHEVVLINGTKVTVKLAHVPLCP